MKMPTGIPWKTFKKLISNGSHVVLSKEIPAGDLNPVRAFHALKNYTPGATLLESGLVGFQGKFSFLHLEPFQEISAFGSAVTLKNSGKTRLVKGKPLDILRKNQRQTKIKASHFLARYTGGLVGYLGYGAIRLFENIPDRHRKNHNFADFVLRRYRHTVAFDHDRHRVVISTLAFPGDDPEKIHREASRNLEKLIKALQKKIPDPPIRPGTGKKLKVEPSPNKADFKEKVEKARAYIQAGEIFQVVLSRNFGVSLSVSPFEVYQVLHQKSPSPFMFYLDFPDRVVCGASPEKLVSLEGGILETCPLAGTRPRGTDKSDKELAEELVSDPKERAEHMMLVDLARNDIGAVSEPGSVKVSKLMEVQLFEHVMHIASTVRGKMAKGFDAFDALRYCLPAGTLSGAPKIRAMEIIDELEEDPRHFYGGCVFAIDHAGNLNSCITIRAMEFEKGRANVRAGAGIVFDSDPETEAGETRHKARSVLEAISLAEGKPL